MIIKTITCHDVYNYGASLQAFALQNFLESKGHDVKIIDYKPAYIRFHYKFDWFVHPASSFKRYTDKSRILHFLYCFGRYLWYLISLSRKRAFNQFTKEYLHLTPMYRTYSDIEQNLEEADVYIVGSDQVWNSTTMQNGLDPAFYLQFVTNKRRRISYAASFGSNKVDEKEHDNIVKWLKSLDAISVRESSGIELLQQEKIDGKHVCDPVFLISKEQWWKVLDINVIKDKYVLIYNLTSINDRLLSDAVYLASKKGLKLYSVSPMNIGQADKCFKSVSPMKFVELIVNAQYVFTNSFHATAFSIISNRQFFTYNYHSGENSSRMKSVLREMGLLSQFNIKSIEEGLMTPIDYKSIDDKVEMSRRNGQEWLLSNI